jgi:hypothetical protein
MHIPVPRRDAAWWGAIRQARDATLAILRGPLDPAVVAILRGPTVPTFIAADPLWAASVWSGALAEVEAWSARLDAAYLRFATWQTYGLTGTA